MKKPWKIALCILINFGRSEGITVEDKEAIYTNVKEIFTDGKIFDESYKTSENLTTFEYEIVHFNNTHAEVRHTFEKNDF